jgi:hypothetical protein
MQILKRCNLILTIAFALLAVGCAPMMITGAAEVDQKAFGAKKRFAVVSIASLKTFQGEKGVTQLFKNADEIPGANTQPLLNKLHPKIMSSLGSSKHFTLVPEAKVLTSSGYKDLAEDARVVKVLFFSEDINVANKYKYVSDAQKYAKLAKDLRVDGAKLVNF